MTQFRALCHALAEAPAFSHPPPDPGSFHGSPFDAEKLAALVRHPSGAFPHAYRPCYATPLATGMAGVTAALQLACDDLERQGRTQAEALANTCLEADTLVGAVVDWGNATLEPHLCRFEAVVSDFYRAFLARPGAPAVTSPLPPLVTFARDRGWGPFTMTQEKVDCYCKDISNGVVSLPRGYAAWPLLWGPLAHEVGGHDVVHAVPGLAKDLVDGIGKLGGLRESWRPAWGHWTEEVAADIYGLLNMGPAFVVALAAWLAVDHEPLPKLHLGEVETFIRLENGELVDAHPPGLLRLHALLGGLEALDPLETRPEWQQTLQGIVQELTPRPAEIDVFDDALRLFRGLTYELDPLAAEARRVGNAIATMELSALGGQSIRDVETWRDKDEGIAKEIRHKRPDPSQINPHEVDDAHLLAGAVLACYDDPGKADELNAWLNAALLNSYQHDPIFGARAGEV